MPDITNLLEKLLIYVPNGSVSEFKTNHTGTGITSSDDFWQKLCFLGGTGEIATHGEVFAVNKESDIESLQQLVGLSLTGTDANSLGASTVIAFIQAVYDIVETHGTIIGDSSSGLVKDVNTLKTEVETTTTGLIDKTTAVENSVSTLIGADTGKSVRTVASEEVAKIVANADSSYDTLKEIADWILNDTTGAAAMANDIEALQTAIGIESSEGVDATGIYSRIEDLESAIGEGGSVASQITNEINKLDADKTSADMAAPSASTTVTINSYVSAANKVQVVEADGKITTVTVTGVSADAAGAAQKAYDTLIGQSDDAISSYTIHGAFNYAKRIVDDKNVTAESSYTALITATANNNKVTVDVTDRMKSGIDYAYSAVQSIAFTSGNQTYISVSGSPGVQSASLSVTPNMGTVSISNNTFTYTNGLAYTQNIADILSSINPWGEYVAS